MGVWGPAGAGGAQRGPVGLWGPVGQAQVMALEKDRERAGKPGGREELYRGHLQVSFLLALNAECFGEAECS